MKLKHRPTDFTVAIVSVAFALPVAVSFAFAPAQAAGGCAGVQLQPGANLQNTINSNGTNTTFCLADGSYTTTAALKPKDGDRFIGVYTDATQPNIANIATGGVFSGGRNLLIQDLGIGPSTNTGLNPGTGSTITGSHIHDNQMCGIETAANSLIITGNEIDHNGTLATRGDACGIKLHGYAGADSGAYSTVTGNIVHDNTGHGLWVDCDGHDNSFSGNSVYNNAGVAINDETSYNNSFTNNILHDNGFGWSSYAISILDSIGTKAIGNTLTNNYKGVNIWEDRRATLSSPSPGLGCANAHLTGYHPSGIVLRSNIFTTPQRSGLASNGSVPLSAVSVDDNCWTVAAHADTNWRLPTDSTATWSQWLGAGQDSNGQELTTGC
jgi:hypothetical protein